MKNGPLLANSVKLVMLIIKTKITVTEGNYVFIFVNIQDIYLLISFAMTINLHIQFILHHA